jgi:ABC-type Mn2+/Zn2+ transport system ATPase subunit
MFWMWRNRRDTRPKGKTNNNGFFPDSQDNAVSLKVTPHLSLKNISYGYTSHKPVIEDLNLQIPRGRFVGLLGPSGSGKTTLIKIIAGLYKPWTGSLEYSISNTTYPYETIVDQRQVVIGYVPQIETIDWTFPVTVREVVGMGIWNRSGVFPFISSSNVRRIDKILNSLGIHNHEFGKRQIRELSGGEQQRVFLARALVRNPSILVLDEPISGVDHNTKEKILRVLTSLNQAGLTIIMATHDLAGISRRLPWVICINKKVIAQGRPSDILTDSNLLKTYGLVVDKIDNAGSDNNIV